MVEIICDRCDQTFEADPARDGEKIPCPSCGDINRVPGDSTHPARSREADEVAPEETLLFLRPSIWRAHPFAAAFLAIAPLALVLGGGWGANLAWLRTGWAFLAPAAGWLILAGWWTWTRLRVSLEVTNRRIVERRGIISRASSEIRLGDIRNIRIKQSLLNRLMQVGTFSIESAAGNMEEDILMRDVAKPNSHKQVIDEARGYR